MSEHYGFSMLIPQGTECEEKEWDGGWAGLYAESEGVKFYGLCKLEEVSAKDIEKFGVKVTGIPADK
ncbi:MAG: hypothetical protein HYU36_21705 [Planctomycetes bacterium]|nr:hypothetical protein [Planctomycetota bacterium]